MKYFFIFLLFSLNLSCVKMLDVEIESDITELNYWENEGDFNTYLTGIYGYFKARLNELDFGEDRSDMWKAGSISRFSPYWSQEINADNSRDWQQFYACIGQCNLLLDKIEEFNFSNKKEKDRIIAETLSIRAYMYFYISKIYGDVPLALEPVKDETFPQLPRSPKKDVFEQIVKDLENSIDKYPTDNLRDKYYFSKPSTYALLADVSIWMAKVLDQNAKSNLERCVSAIEWIENNTDIELLEDFSEITERKNKEIVLSLFMSRDEGEMYAKFGYPIEQYSEGADNANELPIATSANTGYATYTLNDIAFNLFASNPIDKRIPSSYIIEKNNGVDGLIWPNKFRGHIFSDGRIADDDIILYRWGGLLLLKAEAMAGLKESSEAIDVLNKVRRRAGIGDFNSTDIKEIEEEILDERGRELLFENKRWFDLVRAHFWGTIDIYSLIPNLIGKNTPIYWPVQTNTLSLNHNLEQTPGY